ncbi:MAG: tRNA (adenosine(37)-N6)-dimethylallyltransferase MiaA [Bacteroidales bacterium]|nr:tRNA (adenosine(37)-N6)-dimethylallyltransferase MiaA [Bacteroidales bacterium]
MKNKNALFIVGPTGVGKTETAVRIAAALGTEIISADSRQVYKELSIGTAVPGPEHLGRVRHHLIQHRSVKDYYNASMFEVEALQILKKLFKQCDIVVITGGSGLYIQAVCDGIDDVPSVDPGIRRNLMRRLEEEGLESLRFELKKIDPHTWSSIDLKNPKRILKALEISLTTGKPYSSFLTRKSKKRNFSILKIGLNLDRDVLYGWINQRVEDMMELGLLDEVRACMAYRDLNALNTVGYKELFDYLDGRISLDEAVHLIKRNSRRYARRQMTWFNRDDEISWFRPDQFNEIMDHIRQHAKKRDQV